jgi:hypothetical protein
VSYGQAATLERPPYPNNHPNKVYSAKRDLAKEFSKPTQLWNQVNIAVFTRECKSTIYKSWASLRGGKDRGESPYSCILYYNSLTTVESFVYPGSPGPWYNRPLQSLADEQIGHVQTNKTQQFNPPHLTQTDIND